VNQCSWAPDGRAILALGLTETGQNAIVRIDADTSAVTQLLDRGITPRLSPDGKTLVFAKGGPIITTRNLETGEESDVVENQTVYWDLSPDGRHVVYQRAGAVMVVPLTGGEPRELFRGLAEYYRLQWTRDGRYIIATSIGQTAAKEGSKVWSVRASGATPQRLELSPTLMTFLSVHPDGRRVAMTENMEAKNELWVMENFLPAVKEKKQ